jgi:putative molybdopterin biosynthesis protein
VRFAIWKQGFIVNTGNPKSIRHVEDLTVPGVTIINTEPGAGSRGLLNRLLHEKGIPFHNVRGYQNVVHSSVASAETIAAGLADCSIGIEAAARATDLDFLFLNEEPYDLVIPDHFLETQAVVDMLEALKRRSFRRQVESLGGYDTSPMGLVM